MQMITKANAGLGAARNTVADAESGDFLMFVDSDDLVTVDAIGRMVVSLDTSGSDFATGLVQRFDSSRTWRSSLTSACFNRYQTGANIRFVADLVYDSTAWNKLFRPRSGGVEA